MHPNTETTEETKANRITYRQIRAIHEYCKQIAPKLNEAGIDQKTIVSDLSQFDTPITKEFLIEVLRSIQFTLYRTSSKKDLTTSQVQEMWDVFNKFVGERYGIHSPFPSLETLMLAQLENEALR